MKPNLPKLLTLTLSLELILAPVAPAIADTTKTNKVMNTVNQALNVGGSLMQSVGINPMGIGGGNMGVYGNDLQMLEQQKMPATDTEVFNSAMLKSKIPGLAEYMASHPANLDCAVLKPLNVVEPDICDPSGGGIPQDPRVAQMYLQQANQFKTSFKDIKLLYSDSSKEFQGAKACMSSATNVLENFFNDKLSELDKLTNELNRMNAEFIKGSAGEKSEIALATELLDGKDPKLAADTDAVFRDSEMKKLKAEFGNPACTSLDGFKTDNLASAGLRATQTKLTEDMNLKSPNGLNGATFTSKYGEVVADINKVAEGYASNIKNHLGEAGLTKGSLNQMISQSSSEVGSNFGITAAIKATDPTLLALSNEFNNSVLPLNTKQDVALKDLGSKYKVDPAVVSALTNPNTTNFDTLVNTMSNNMKQDCLNRTLSSSTGSLDYIKSKSYDPTKSKEANVNSSYIFDKELASILTDPSTSPEEKQALLKKAKKDERRVVRQNSWFNVSVLGNDGNKDTKTVAKGNIAASDFYAEVINNCDAQFKGNKLAGGSTAQSAIETLKSLRTQYTKMASAQADKLKATLVKKLISCESSDVANSAQPGSCSSSRFDTTKPGFCAAAANSCSTNMQACTAQTKQKVENLEKARTVKVQNYNLLVKNHVASLKTLYDKTQALYEGQTKVMQGGFAALGVAGFSLPGGIDADPKTSKLAGFSDHDVFLEDPAAAFAAFKNNVTLLKGEVTKYQTALIKGVKDYSNKKVALYSSVSSDAAQMESNCTAAIGGFNKGMADKGKSDSELLKKFGQKLPRVCSEYDRMANEHPNGACPKDFKEFVESGLEASNFLGSAGSADTLAEYYGMCDLYNNHNEDNPVATADYVDTEMCQMINAAEGKDQKLKDLKVNVANDCKLITKIGLTDADKRLSCTTTKDDKGHETFNCESQEKKATDRVSNLFKRAIKSKLIATDASSAPTINSSAPVFCEADANGNYRYNDKAIKQKMGLGQTGGSIATGM